MSTTTPSQFFVTLPSTASLDEYTHNQANDFKVRLPQPLHFPGQHWEVALSAVTLPDTTESIVDRLGYSDLSIPEADKVADSDLATIPLFSTVVVLAQADGTLLSRSPINISPQDILQSFTTSSGEAFMISLRNVLTHRFTMFLTDSTRYLVNPKTKKRTVFGRKTKKRTVLDLHPITVGTQMEMLLDNSNLDILTQDRRPLLAIRTDLAIKMGWLAWDNVRRRYLLGPNLAVEDIDGTMTSDSDYTKGFEDRRGHVSHYKIHKTTKNKMMVLSPTVNWRFTNLNAAYDALRGSPARTLMVYSDATDSSIVGGQTVDLLREIPYHRKEKGSMYVEPRHLQFRTIRSQMMETIHIQFSEQNGDLVKFDSRQPSSVTLLFRQNV